jgi:hypothetical protein
VALRGQSWLVGARVWAEAAGGAAAFRSSEVNCQHIACGSHLKRDGGRAGVCETTGGACLRMRDVARQALRCAHGDSCLHSLSLTGLHLTRDS